MAMSNLSRGPAVARPAAPRLDDVADRAGVTKSIASRILNSASVAVRDETRERVHAAAKELGYRPNPAARALSRGTTGCIAMVVPDLANSVYSRIVRGAVGAATGGDLTVVVVEDSPEIGGLEVLLQTGRVDGVLMLAARPDHPLVSRLVDGSTPCVFAHRAVPGSGRNVIIDDALASALAVEHLQGLGHRCIAHIGGPRRIDTADRRALGFRERAKALDVKPAPVVRTSYTERAGAEAARKLLTRAPEVTAIFTASLAQAVGAMAAAAELGLDVPGRVSLVSYDDMPFADYMRPPLTTVRVPMEELGATALRSLLEQLSGAEAREQTIATPPELVLRQSTAPPS